MKDKLWPMKVISSPQSGSEHPTHLDKLEAGACCFFHPVLCLLSCYLKCAIGLHYSSFSASHSTFHAFRVNVCFGFESVWCLFDLLGGGGSVFQIFLPLHTITWHVTSSVFIVSAKMLWRKPCPMSNHSLRCQWKRAVSHWGSEDRRKHGSERRSTFLSLDAILWQTSHHLWQWPHTVVSLPSLKLENPPYTIPLASLTPLIDY